MKTILRNTSVVLVILGLLLSGISCSKSEPEPTETPTESTESVKADEVSEDRNEPPIAPSVRIAPVSPVTTQDLKVEVVTDSTDADGDPVTYRYAWFKNDVLQPSLTDPIIAAAMTFKTQTWRVVVTPNDGKVDGISAEDSVTVMNSPPAKAVVGILPASPSTTHDLKARIMNPSFDPDRDEITYAYMWYEDGVLRSSQSSQIVNSSETEKEQTWRVVVVPTDGEVEGPSSQAEVTVVNSPPMAPVVVIEPALPVSDDALVAHLEQDSVDADGDSLTYTYDWYKDSTKQPSLTGSAVDANLTARRQTWRVIVTPHDGQIEGPTAEATVTIVAEHSSLDYFKTEEGHGIRYHVTDDYKSLDCYVWTVSQHVDREKADADFLFTLVKEGCGGGHYGNSAISGRFTRNILGMDLTFFNHGGPVSNQSNFYWRFQIPSFFDSGDDWAYVDRQYSVEHITTYIMNGTTFDDCIKITIDASQDENDYLRGSGYYVLARDIGIVEIVFNRASGESCRYEYVEHRQLTSHTLTGKVVSVQQAPIVQISTLDWGGRSIPDSDGNFSLHVYGPDVVIWIGFDGDDDGTFDFDDYPNYPRNYIVNDITSDVEGLFYVLP